MEKELEFGTGGIRAIMGPGMDQLNVHTIRKNTEGYARYVEAKMAEFLSRENEVFLGGFGNSFAVNDKLEKSIVIAFDNRNNSKEFAFETAKVLSNHGIKVFLFDSLRPTPELSFAVRYLHAFGGIVITASHNPPQYNGYKIYDRFGCQCVPRDTDEIIKFIKDVRLDGDLSSLASKNNLERDNEYCQGENDRINELIISDFSNDVDEAYYRALETVQENPDLIKDIKIVYTPLHGTGYVPVTTMFDRIGYEHYEISEQCRPDGDFSNTSSPNPEDKEAFDLAIDKAKEVDADIIMATDPDCDRIGLVVKHDGEYEYLTGNQTGAIFLKYLIETKEKKGTLSDDAIVFNSIVTGGTGEKICKKYNIVVESTLTGFKYIGDKIREYEGKKTFLFGYEESYGYLIKDFTRDKDGVQAAILAAEACNYYKSIGLTLIDVLNSIYEEYGYCEDRLETKLIEGEEGLAEMNRLVDEYRSADMVEYKGRKVVAKEDYLSSVRTNIDGSTTSIDLPKSNVVKLFLEDGSWVVVRPSGNEPKIKYYENIWKFSKNGDRG